MGCSHLKRSLRTDSPALAIRLARKAAFEVEAIFEEQPRESGLGYDPRLIVAEDLADVVGTTIARRSARASATNAKSKTDETVLADNPVLTLADIYDRYIKDPTKRRSARTMLAHDTTRRVVQDVLGASTPIADVTREQCRDLAKTVRAQIVCDPHL
jgi:hypothetical protein